jgi:hypothetical protein
MSKRRYRKSRGGSEEQYFGLFYAMARSDAFRSLSGPALKVFIEIRTRFNGGNNGELSLSLDEAARCWALARASHNAPLPNWSKRAFFA